MRSPISLPFNEVECVSCREVIVNDCDAVDGMPMCRRCRDLLDLEWSGMRGMSACRLCCQKIAYVYIGTGATYCPRCHVWFTDIKKAR